MSLKYTHRLDELLDDDLWKGRTYVPRHRRRRLYERYGHYIVVWFDENDNEILRFNTPSASWAASFFKIQIEKEERNVYCAKMYNPNMNWYLTKIPFQCTFCKVKNNSVSCLNINVYICNECWNKSKQYKSKSSRSPIGYLSDDEEELNSLERCVGVLRLALRVFGT